MKLWILLIIGITLALLSYSSYYYFNEYRTYQQKLPALLQKSYDFLLSDDYDSAKHYAKKVLAQAQNTNNIAFAEGILGYCMYASKNYDSAYYYYTNSYNSSLVSDSTDHHLQIKAMNMLGIVFEKFEEHKKAIDYFKKGLDILKEHENKMIMNIYYNMAYNQSQISDIECVKSYYKALGYAIKYEDRRHEAMVLNDLGNLMRETGEYSAAIEHYKSTLETDYAKESPKYSAFAHQGLGEVYYYIDSLTAAEKQLLLALEYKQDVVGSRYKFTSYRYLARVKVKQNKIKQAENYYQKAVELFPLAALSRKNIKIFEEISRVEALNGKHEKSAQSKIRYYAELENYLDQQERGRELVKRDVFGRAVLAKDKEYKSKANLSYILNSK